MGSPSECPSCVMPKELALRWHTVDTPQTVAVPTSAAVHVASHREAPGLEVDPVHLPDLLNSLGHWPRGRPHAGARTDLLVYGTTL